MNISLWSTGVIGFQANARLEREAPLMELLEIDETTEDTYYRCLHDEIPADPRVIAMRKAWRVRFQPRGHRAKVLKNDAGQVVGLTNYIPVEHSPYEGRNLMSILCMWIHGYDHLVGNQQAKGYGRFMLGEIEADARESGLDGLVVWAKDYDAWNPVSFYEHMGFERADQNGLDVLAWKPFNARAERPAFLKRSTLIATERPTDDKVAVTLFSNGWCGGGCQLCMMARDVAHGLPEEVVFTEVLAWEKEDMRERGESIDMLYVEGEAFRPDGPPASPAELKAHLLSRFRSK
jgi:GNAT superfamily N-acetyltransferase